MSWQLCLIIVISVLALTQGQKPKMGRCRRPDPMPGFREDKFVGPWYLFASTPIDKLNGSKCGIFQHYPPTGRKWPLTLFIVDSSGEKHNSTVNDRIISHGAGITHFQATYSYLKVDENYNKYALAYTCKDEGDSTYIEKLFVFTRSKTPNTEEFSPELVKLWSEGYPVTELKTRDLSGCPEN